MAIEDDQLNRLVTAKVAGVQEEVVERALRPRMLDEYVGQEKIRGQLSIFIEAARKRRESLDHVNHEPRQMIGRQPLLHARREQKLGIAINRNKARHGFTRGKTSMQFSVVKIARNESPTGC